MSATVATPGRSIRRWPCAGCGVLIGQEQILGTPCQDSLWLPVCCASCHEKLRHERLAAEENAAQVVEIAEEADRRIAADPQFEERVRERAEADLREAVRAEVEIYWEENYPEFEERHRNQARDEIVAEIESEMAAKFIERLRSAERLTQNGEQKY